MSQEVKTRITKVFDPEGNKPYNILTEGQPNRLATFKVDIGEKAKEYQGQFGTLTFSTQTSEKNGNVYTNYMFEGFVPAETLDDEVQAGILNGDATRGTTSPSTGQTSPGHRMPLAPEEQQSIRRAVALDRATDFLPYLPEAERTVGGVTAIAKQLEGWLRGE